MRIALTTAAVLLLAAAAPAVSGQESGAAEGQDRSAAAVFHALEGRLLRAGRVEMDFHVTATGVAQIEVQGHLSRASDGHIEITASGEFGGQPVELTLRAGEDQQEFGSGPELRTAPRSPHLWEAIVIGFTRMGILHNLARLTGNAAPDHADGGVAEWVRVSDFSAAEGGASGVRFHITVSGQPVGSATLEMQDGVPAIRRQTIGFPEGDMHVVERYSGVIVER